jgi:hypothetical protein
VFSIDPLNGQAGSSLRIDGALLGSGATANGLLEWTGTIPPTASSVRLRYFFRYSGAPAQNFDTGILFYQLTGDGVSSTVDGSTHSAVLNDFSAASGYSISNTTLVPEKWYCIELALTRSNLAANFDASLSLGGTVIPAISHMPTAKLSIVDKLRIGLGLPVGNQPPFLVWIDSVILSTQTAPIGCN